MTDIAPQGSARWHAQRLGCVTASEFGTVIGASKKNANKLAIGFSTAAETYAWQLLAEMITRLPDVVSAPALEWGHKYEPMARREYEATRDCGVEPAEFIEHENHPWIGGSPDSMVWIGGTVIGHGILEIKCPKSSAVHLRTLEAREMPVEHYPQVQGNMWVTGCDWCDFISFDPRCDDSTRLFVQRIKRDDAYIEKMAPRLIAFRDLVHAAYQRITGYDEFVVTGDDIRRIDQYLTRKPWERLGMFYQEDTAI